MARIETSRHEEVDCDENGEGEDEERAGGGRCWARRQNENKIPKQTPREKGKK